MELIDRAVLWKVDMCDATLQGPNETAPWQPLPRKEWTLKKEHELPTHVPSKKILVNSIYHNIN